MILENLRISRVKYGDDEGQLRGKIEFKGGTGEIALNLSEELSNRIVAICADELVNASKAVAENMTAEIITSVPQIESDQ